MRYMIIDTMEHKIYRYSTDIEMGFAIDMVLEERDRLEIPYRLVYYNNGRVISIRGE